MAAGIPLFIIFGVGNFIRMWRGGTFYTIDLIVGILGIIFIVVSLFIRKGDEQEKQANHS